MNPTQLPNTRSRTNRVLIALAAAWMIVSLAIGGVVGADSEAVDSASVPVTGAVLP